MQHCCGCAGMRTGGGMQVNTPRFLLQPMSSTRLSQSRAWHPTLLFIMLLPWRMQGGEPRPSRPAAGCVPLLAGPDINAGWLSAGSCTCCPCSLAC